MKDTVEIEQEIKSSASLQAALSIEVENFPELTVQAYLSELLKTHGAQMAQVIREANIDRTYGYHIFSGDKKSPGREKLLALALAMKLSPEEAQRLLYVAGRERLYVKNEWDRVIFYALEKRISVAETNAILQDLSLRPLIE